MGDPRSEEEEYNNVINMEDIQHEEVSRLTLSHNLSATNEVNRSPAWKIVHSKKRARRSSSNDSDGELSQATQNNNRYSVHNGRQNLPNNHQTQTKQVDQAASNNNREPKPSPIVIPGVKSIRDFSAMLEEAGNGVYAHKTIDSNGQLKIMAKDSESYRKIIRKLDEEGASYHTYQLNHQRAYRVVIRSLHPSNLPAEVKEAIRKHGHQVRNIVNIRHWESEVLLPIFFVDLEPNRNNKDIYKLDWLLNVKIQIEPPKKKTSTQLCNAHRCVKCGDEHNTANCTKF